MMMVGLQQKIAAVNAQEMGRVRQADLNQATLARQASGLSRNVSTLIQGLVFLSIGRSKPGSDSLSYVKSTYQKALARAAQGTYPLLTAAEINQFIGVVRGAE
jgi:hypothetical protein